MASAVGGLAPSGTNMEYYAMWGTGWNYDLCMAASPINQWTAQSWLLMTVHAAGWALWLANTLFDNEGHTIHLIQWRWTQLYLVIPIAYMIQTLIIKRDSQPAGTVKLSWSNLTD